MPTCLPPAAGLLGTLHLIGYLLGTLASPSLNAKVGALALCRASHFVFACAMLVCGLTSDITTMAASRFVAGLAAGFGVFSIFLIVFDATEPEKRSAAGSLVWSGIGVAIVASGLASGPILDGGAWRLSFIVPAALALAVAVFIPRTASAARAQPKAADASPSRLAELTSARWIFLLASYFLFAAGYISYVTFAGVMLKGIGLSSVGVTWFWVMYGASSIVGAALGAALLSGGFARRIALSAALGSGAIGSLLAVHGENWSVFAASVLVGLGSVAMPAIVTFLIRNRTSDAAYPFFFYGRHREPGSRPVQRTRGRGTSRRLVRSIGHRLVRRRNLWRRHACRRRRWCLRPDVERRDTRRGRRAHGSATRMPMRSRTSWPTRPARARAASPAQTWPSTAATQRDLL